MKKNIAFFLAVIIATTLFSGCSNKEAAADGTTVNAVSVPATVANVPEPTEAEQPKGNILVWAMGAEGENMATIATKFQKDNPGITVDAQIIGWGQAHDKFVTAIAAQTGPDVAQIGSSWVAEFGATGTLADMSQFTSKYPNMAPDKFSQGVIDLCTYEGKYSAIPWYIDEDVLFYRTDILKEVGYDKAPATWSDLIDCAEKLVKRNGGKYAFGNMDPRTSNRVFQFMWQNGADILDKDGKPIVNSPQALEAVNFFKSFFDIGATPITATGATLIEDFKNGVFPMFYGAPWVLNELKKSAPELAGKYATAVLPGKITNTSNIGGCELATFTFSANQDAGVKFIDYLSQGDTQIAWLKLTTDLPAAKASWDNDALKNDPLLSTFGTQLENVKTTPSVKQYNQIETTFRDYLEKIIVGKEDVTSSMNELNSKLSEIMKN